MKRVIMCNSRLGILHFSVAASGIEAASGLRKVGRAVIEVVRNVSVKMRVIGRDNMLLEKCTIYAYGLTFERSGVHREHQVRNSMYEIQEA